ncbi:MAG: hypothetical protein KDA41_20710, partial [Planctomycetales bacterium]|nr:hypothetical protein [Planctomycetales bacterium]
MATFDDDREQLAWDAFRYVDGQMTPDELQAFESTLESHQDAREAVARAVELTQAAAAALSHDDAPPAVRRKNRRVALAVGWMAAGAAVCLLVVFGLGQAWHSGHDGETAST